LSLLAAKGNLVAVTWPLPMRVDFNQSGFSLTDHSLVGWD